MALKSARIVDFCDTLNGFEDFENTADHELAGNFGLDAGLFLSGSSDHGY